MFRITSYRNVQFYKSFIISYNWPIVAFITDRTTVGMQLRKVDLLLFENVVTLLGHSSRWVSGLIPRLLTEIEILSSHLNNYDLILLSRTED